MEKQSYRSRSSKLSAKSRLYIVIIAVIFFIAGLFFLGMLGMEIISGMRAYVGSEGLYSKNQKSAAFHLILYAHTWDLKEYEKYTEHMKSPLGYRQARIELEKETPDLEIVYGALIQGGSHPKDVKTMAKLFRWFRNFQHIDKAIDIWTHGDAKIEELESLVSEFRLSIAENQATDAITNSYIDRIKIIDSELTEMENEFSYTMGEASRWAKGLLDMVMAGFTLVAGVVCLGLLMFVGKIITNMQKNEDALRRSNEVLKEKEDALHQSKDVMEEQATLKTHIAELNDILRGEQNPSELGNNMLSYLVQHLDAHIGALYLADNRNLLKMVSSYAYSKRKNLSNEFRLGEGIVGQAALEKQKIIITNAPDDYIKAASGLGDSAPRYIIVIPILFENNVIGVLELGSFNELADHQINFLDLIIENIGISLNAANARLRLKDLFEQTQTQSEELQAQEEELRISNEELTEKSKMLEQQQAEDS